VKWIADRLRHNWGGAAAWTLDPGEHPAEAAVLRLDASRAATLLGWRPVLPLAEALDWITEWYRGWADGADARSLTVQQIERYQQRLAPERGGPPD
jgi:CDP-glucose 4,6-dehydratase